MRSKLFDIIKFIVGWPISVVSIIFLLKLLPGSVDVIHRIKTINLPIIILSIFFFQFYFLLRGLLWQEILKEKGYKLPLKKLLFPWSFSELKRYTPGNIWSFLGRIVSFGKLGIKTKDIFSSLLMESEFIVISSLSVSLLSLNFLFNILPDIKYEIFVQPFIVFLVGVIFFAFVFNKKITGNFKNSILPTFGYLQNLKLIFITSSALVCFGIATYFAGASVFFLNPQDFLGYAGFFVFALLIGYISIITPMGLGVREGVITFVLGKTMPLSSATFISIFSRIVFIFSEILFLLFSWVFYQSKSKILSKIIFLITTHKEEFLLTLFILSYFIYFTTASFLRYDAFYTGRFDLGNMDQTVWNTIHGRIFQLTNPNGTNIVSRLSFHADFLLILISPLYFLWGSPKMLLLLQTAVVSLGAFFLFRIANIILENKKVALILSICFLLNPALQYSNLYDFHPVVLATTFLLASFYFMIRKKYLFLILFLILSGLSKENVWVITSLFGLYIAFFQKKRKLGLSIFLISAFLFFILVWIVIPKFAGSEHFALSYYSDFGDSPTGILKSIITSPLKTIRTIFQTNQLIYLKQLFQPLAFLSILSPVYLIFASPSLLIDLLSSNSQLHKIYFQYSASITPFLFIAAVYSLKLLRKIAPSVSTMFFAQLILLSTLFSVYQYGPLLGAKDPNVSMFTERLENEKLIDKFLSRIPKRYSVAATNEVGSHLSHRQKIYTIPVGVDQADVIIMLNRTSLSDEEIRIIKDVDAKLLKDKNYFVVYRDDQFIVFKKKGLKRSFYNF